MEVRVNEIAIPERIEWNFEELKKELTEKTAKYETLVYTDEQIKEAKADRAALNKLKSALNDERLRREREYMKPFSEFKAQVAEIIGIIDKPVAAIDKQIKEAEKKEQNEKRAKIVDIFDQLPNKPEWLRIEQIWDARWLNKSVTFRMIEDNMLGWCGRIDTEVSTISKLAVGSYEALEEYKRTLDLGKAISEGQRQAAIQEAKRKAEEEKKKPLPETFTEAPTAPADQPAPKAEPEKKPEEKPEDSPKMWIRFEALLTMDTATALKKFCVANGIEIRAI